MNRVYDTLFTNKRRRLSSPEPQKSIQSTPCESRNVMQDLINARAEIASLQEHNKRLINLKREAEILFEKEKVGFEHYRNKSEFTINQLNNELKNVQLEKSNFKKDNDSLMKKCESISKDNNHKISNLEKENAALKNELAKVSLELSKIQQESMSNVFIEFEVKELKKTLIENETCIEELRSNLRIKQIEINTLENDQIKINHANQKIKYLENKLGPLQENSQIVNAQIEKLKSFNLMENELHSLRKQVAAYKNDVQQTEILENTIATLECKLNNHKSIEEEAIQLRSNLALRENSLKKWVDVCSEVCENITENQCYPEYLHFYVNNLKKSIMLIVNEKGELQNSISSLELKSKKVEDVLIKAKKQIIVGINTESKNKSMIKRLKKQLYVITWERNDLRELVDSFQKQGYGADTMEQLNKTINGYKNRMAQVEADLV